MAKLNARMLATGFPGGVAHLRLEFCTNNFYEVAAIVKGVGGKIVPRFQDLFMEQGILYAWCPGMVVSLTSCVCSDQSLGLDAAPCCLVLVVLLLASLSSGGDVGHGYHNLFSLFCLSSLFSYFDLYQQAPTSIFCHCSQFSFPHFPNLS